MCLYRLNLHSTVVLFKHPSVSIISSHSSIYILLQFYLNQGGWRKNKVKELHLHSTVVLFKRLRLLLLFLFLLIYILLQFYLNPFGDLSIYKSLFIYILLQFYLNFACKNQQRIIQRDLHSTVVLFKPLSSFRYTHLRQLFTFYCSSI